LRSKKTGFCRSEASPRAALILPAIPTARNADADWFQFVLGQAAFVMAKSRCAAQHQIPAVAVKRETAARIFMAADTGRTRNRSRLDVVAGAPRPPARAPAQARPRGLDVPGRRSIPINPGRGSAQTGAGGGPFPRSTDTGAASRAGAATAPRSAAGGNGSRTPGDSSASVGASDARGLPPPGARHI
jgi:hypothetical protein